MWRSAKQRIERLERENQQLHQELSVIRLQLRENARALDDMAALAIAWQGRCLRAEHALRGASSALGLMVRHAAQSAWVDWFEGPTALRRANNVTEV